MLRTVRRSLWFARLAWDRFRRDPRTFGGAVRRALSTRRARAGDDATKCPIQPTCVPPDGSGRVSLVLPVYDQADLLGDAVRSVLAQTWPDVELVLLDDGSTDAIEPVLAEAAADPRVKVLRQPNRGLPAALTAGFLHTTGEFVGWTSADNLLEPDMVELLVAKLRATPDAAMVYADFVAIDGVGEPLRGGEFRPLQRSGPDSPIVRLPRDVGGLGTHTDNFIGPCFLYRSWVRRAFPEWRGALGVEDWDYWLRLHASFRIVHLGGEATPYRYRWHQNSLNARAQEIRLLDKAVALLDEERRRRAWRSRPWRVRVAASVQDALVLPAPHAVGDGGAEDRVLSVESGRDRTTHEGLRVLLWDRVPDVVPLADPLVLHVLRAPPSTAEAARIGAEAPFLHVPGGPEALGQFVCAWADAAGPPTERASPPPPPTVWSPAS